MTSQSQAALESAANDHFEVRPLAGSLGAELIGVNVADMTDEIFEEVHKSLLEYSVIFFRDQTLTPEDQ